MSGSEEGSGTPDLDRNAAFWPEDDEEIEAGYMHLGSEDSGGKRGNGKSRQGINILPVFYAGSVSYRTWRPTKENVVKLNFSCA
jgi:hypothetical protein